MSHYRIRREGMEFPVAGLEALVRLVQEGTLGPTDKVFDPSSDAWVPAGQLDLLRTPFAERAKEQAARRNRSKRPRPPLLSSAQLGPVAPPTATPPADGESLFEIPPDLEAPSADLPAPDRQQAVIDGGNLRGDGTRNLADEGRSTDPGLGAPPVSRNGNGGEVIAFPDDAPDHSRLSELPPFGTSLDPDQARAALDNPGAFLRSAGTPAPSQPKPAVRPSLIVLAAAVALVGALLWVSYIQLSSNMYNAQQQQPSAAGPTPPLPGANDERGVGEVLPAGEQPTPDPDPRASSGALYEEMELSLRNRMVPGCSTISQEDDLDSALRVELSRLGVHASSIEAPVLSWGGRKGDLPHAVEIEIWYAGQQGELDRELGAIGLVIGKYAQHYGLDVRSFGVHVESAAGATRERSLDANAAKDFYQRRISLLEFLTGEPA